MNHSDCVFCAIISGQAEARVLYRDEEITAFWDNRPAMPVHILIVPNKHIESVNQVEDEDAGLIGRMTIVAKKLAREQGIDQNGFRLVINTGPDAGQSVFHLHMHLIGGQWMGRPR